MLKRPYGVSEAVDGGVLILDHDNVRVRRVRPDGIIITAAGNGDSVEHGNGGPAVDAGLDLPFDVAALPDGGFLVSESGGVRRVWPDGTISSVQADGSIEGLSLTEDGGYVYADGDRVRRVLPDGQVVVVAGNGKPGFSGDFGPATAARLWNPTSVVETPQGGFLVADTFNNRVRLISPGGTITTVAGVPLRGFTGDGTAATRALLYLPWGLALTPDGGFLVSDWNNHRVRKVASYPRGETVPGPGPTPVPDDGGQGSTGEPKSAAGAGAAHPGGAVGPSKGKAQAHVSFKRRGGLRRAIRKGARASIDCSVRCDVSGRIMLRGKAVCRGHRQVSPGGARTLVVARCSRPAQRRITRRGRIAVYLELSVHETVSGLPLFSGRTRLA